MIDRLGSFLSAYEEYPRLNGECPKACGFHGIVYLSMAHFMGEDW